MNESTSPNKAIVALIVIVLIGLIAGGGYLLTKPSDQNTTPISQSSVQDSTTNNTDQNTTSSTNGTYKDGTYEATGSYSSPGGRESIKVSLTIANGNITSSSVTPEAKNPTAKSYQSDFVSSYKSEVNGKPVNEVKLDSVAGSSLTPNGFEDALEQIKQDAAA